jgi:integrase
VALEARSLGTVSINVRITAVRKPAVEAADNGLLAPELANGITRVKGLRLGNWLTAKQPQTLLNASDTTTNEALRDRAILAVLLACGLPRSEVAALMFRHIQQRDGRWCIVDLVGKHGRVCTVPMPTWVNVAIDSWATVAGITDGHVFRSIVTGRCATPHCPRRWFGSLSGRTRRPPAWPESRLSIAAALARSCPGLREGSWRRFQMLMHASVQTTDHYFGTKGLVRAPNDGIKLRIAV